jgi:hypothetical protein
MAVQQGACRTATYMTPGHAVGGLARNCGGLTRDSFADPAQLQTSPSRMGWHRALFQGNSEKAVHDSLEAAGVMMKRVGVRRCN